MSSEMCSGVSFCGAPAGAHPGHIQGARPEKDPRAAGVLRGRVRRTIPRHPRSAAGVRRTSLARVVVDLNEIQIVCLGVTCAVRTRRPCISPCPIRGSGRGSTGFIWIRRSETRETAESFLLAVV